MATQSNLQSHNHHNTTKVIFHIHKTIPSYCYQIKTEWTVQPLH